MLDIPAIPDGMAIMPVNVTSPPVGCWACTWACVYIDWGGETASSIRYWDVLVVWLKLTGAVFGAAWRVARTAPTATTASSATTPPPTVRYLDVDHLGI